VAAISVAERVASEMAESGVREPLDVLENVTGRR
jgi:hypothetical protein